MPLPRPNISLFALQAAFLAVLLLSGPGLRALDPSIPIKQYVHNSWNSVNGLPQDSVQSILQTRDGYLWMGTQEGLVRFNGVEFRTFNRSNSPGLSQDDIRALLEDDDGALWIGTYGGGLVRCTHDRFGNVEFQSFLKSEKLPGISPKPIHLPRDFVLSENLPSNLVLSLAAAKDGSVWAGTGYGLARIRNGVPIPYETPKELLDQEIWSLAVAPDGALWTVANRAVYRLDQQNQARRQFPGEITDATTVSFDNSGQLWIGTSGHGIYKISSGEPVRYYDQRLKNVTVSSIRQDRQGSLWIGLFGGGLCRLNTRHFECHTEDDGLSSNLVSTTYEDREGSLWIGTYARGVDRLRQGKFLTYNRRDGLAADPVTALYEGRDRSIWTGTANGISRLKDGEIISYKIDPAQKAANSVLSLAGDREGFLWIGTEDGLHLFRNGRVVKTWRKEQGLAANRVDALHQDLHGNLWIGDRYGGLTRLRGEQARIFSRNDGLVTDHVRTIFEDRKGNLWFGTSLGVTELTGDKFINYAISVSPSATADGATCFYEDHNGDLWIGTWSSGIARIRNGELTLLDAGNSVFEKPIWGLVGDDDGNLWMIENLGLFRISLRDLNALAERQTTAALPFHRYGISDGLLSPEFSGGSQMHAWKASSGKLYFAGFMGLVEVDPRNLHMNSLAPPVVIEQATLDAGPLENGARVLPVKNRLEFRFAALSYLAPGNIAYKYKLEGFDREYRELRPGAGRAAFYTSLPPGDYHFRVIASNDDGVWNEEGATFDVTLKPYFYQTWWFRLLGAVTLVFAGLGFNFLRLRQLKRQVAERTHDLLVAKEAAESATRAKSEFLANMSHEIRTPLNGIVGMLELARQSELTSEQKGFLNIAEESAHTLLTVIHDILDFSKIEAGKLEICAEDFRPSQVIEDAVRTMTVRAREKKLDLICQIAPHMPDFLIGDRLRLKQVLLNLLDNAVKFTERGEITISAHVDMLAADSAELQVCVADTGIGIPAAQQKVIFEAFRQADSSVTRRFRGTGLGLAICSRLVALMGGKIRVESVVGQGSRFYFTARLGVPSTAEASRREGLPELDGLSALVADVPKLKILLAEDNLVNQTLAVRLLEKQGHEVVLALSGKEALDRIEEAETNFDLVLMDVQMPEMDGLAATGAIRKREQRIGGHLPIIAMTAYAMKGDRERCLEAGMDDYLAKPINTRELLHAISTAIELGRPATFKRPQSTANGKDASPGKTSRVSSRTS